MTPTYSSKTRQLLDLLGVEHPLVQAPMVGVSNPQLAAAVASAGALGSIGLGAGSAASIDAAQLDLAAVSNRPINLNFFCHATPQPDNDRESAWLFKLQPHFAALGAAPPQSLSSPYGSFDDDPETLQALLRLPAKIVSFHFGLPSPETISALKTNNCLIMGSATSAAEAMFLQDNGVDVVIAQGWEAGGHRGTFSVDATRVDATRAHAHQQSPNDEQLGTLALIPQICASIDVPVIAAGGINTGEGVAAALALGAAGVQIGTAFISCPESSANTAYRRALEKPNAQTIMTRVFSGRHARGLANVFTDALDRQSHLAPDYPVAYAAGKALAAAAQNSSEEDGQNYGALWAGQAFRNNRTLPAAELVATIIDELHNAQR